jgi:hypothetical protein
LLLLQTGWVRKADLQKKKNDDEIEEGWVQCDACESWVHQICGLFNKGKNDQNVHYLCPKCLMLVRGAACRILCCIVACHVQGLLHVRSPPAFWLPTSCA